MDTAHRSHAAKELAKLLMWFPSVQLITHALTTLYNRRVGQPFTISDQQKPFRKRY